MNKIPTTFEMDGLLTQKDIDERHFVMRNCQDCNQWYRGDTRKGNFQPCSYCGSGKYDMKTQISLRTYNPNSKKTRRTKKEVR